MKNLLVCTSLISLMSIEAQALKVYLVSNHDKIRDHNQVLGIGTTLKNISPKKISLNDLDAKALTPSEIKDKIEKDLSQEKVIVIGAGEGGLEGVKDLPIDPNLVTCLTYSAPLEQYTDPEALEKVDFISLPTHRATPEVKEQLGEKLIETVGVAHNQRPDMTTYDEWKKELPPADIYFGVYLGGDDPFPEEDASHLANYVIRKAKELEQMGSKVGILVLNGPQTGKHDETGKERLTVHREGKSDPITEHFANQLAESGIEHKVFDFQYNTPENEKWVRAYKAFDLVAGAVRTTKGKMIVPGDSTLVTSKTIDIMTPDAIETMPPGKVLIYHNAVLKDVHRAHIASQQNAGRASILEFDQEVRPASEVSEVTLRADKVIAQKLLQAVSAEEPTDAQKKDQS